MRVIDFKFNRSHKSETAVTLMVTNRNSNLHLPKLTGQFSRDGESRRGKQIKVMQCIINFVVYVYCFN